MNKPESKIVAFYVRFIFLFINVLALYIFLRGHNKPGGGFIAGITCALSLILIHLTLSKKEFQNIIPYDPITLTVLGLGLAYISALAPILFELPFLTHKMIHAYVPILGDLHIGTPLLFDLGVFFVVVGVTSKITFMFSSTYTNKDYTKEELSS